MTTTSQLQISSIPASIENAEEWQEIAVQIPSESGLPTQVTPEMLTGMIGSAVPLLFEADVAKDAALLRGTFTEPVIVQRQHTAGCLEGQRPVSVTVKLVGAHMAEGHPVLRAHLAIQAQQTDGTEAISSQFWDIELGTSVTIGQTSCPNCGAPIAEGELICSHCQADVRAVVQVPLVVSRLELY